MVILKLLLLLSAQLQQTMITIKERVVITLIITVVAYLIGLLFDKNVLIGAFLGSAGFHVLDLLIAKIRE